MQILLVVQGGPDKVHDWFHGASRLRSHADAPRGSPTDALAELKNLYPQSDEDEVRSLLPLSLSAQS